MALKQLGSVRGVRQLNGSINAMNVSPGSPVKFYPKKINETDVAYEVKRGIIIEPSGSYRQAYKNRIDWNSPVSANWENCLSALSAWSKPVGNWRNERRRFYLLESPESIPDQTWNKLVQEEPTTVPSLNQEAKKDDSVTKFIERAAVGGAILGMPIAVQGCSQAQIAVALNSVPYITEDQSAILAQQLFSLLKSDPAKIAIVLFSGGLFAVFVLEQINPKASSEQKFIWWVVGALAGMVGVGLLLLIANVMAPTKQKLEQNQQQKPVPELQEKSSPTPK
jgi:hypothetical protein